MTLKGMYGKDPRFQYLSDKSRELCDSVMKAANEYRKTGMRAEFNDLLVYRIRLLEEHRQHMQEGSADFIRANRTISYWKFSKTHNQPGYDTF